MFYFYIISFYLFYLIKRILKSGFLTGRRSYLVGDYFFFLFSSNLGFLGNSTCNQKIARYTILEKRNQFSQQSRSGTLWKNENLHST